MNKIILMLMMFVSCNSFADGFGIIIQVGKGETKQFTVTGLHEPFSYTMRCEIIIPDYCSGNWFESSAYILATTINGKTTLLQTDYEVKRPKLFPYYECDSEYGRVTGTLVHGVRNNSIFKFINRPNYNLDIICKVL